MKDLLNRHRSVHRGAFGNRKGPSSILISAEATFVDNNSLELGQAEVLKTTSDVFNSIDWCRSLSNDTRGDTTTSLRSYDTANVVGDTISYQSTGTNCTRADSSWCWGHDVTCARARSS